MVQTPSHGVGTGLVDGLWISTTHSDHRYDIRVVDLSVNYVVSTNVLTILICCSRKKGFQAFIYIYSSPSGSFFAFCINLLI